MTNLVNRIKVPIGDWSDDGHGKCDYYFVNTNKTLEELFDLHFLASEKLGFNIGEMCGRYEEYRLKPDMVEKLLAANISKYISRVVSEFNNPLITEEDFRDYPGDTRNMAELWFACMKYADPTMEYKVDEEEKVPTLYNWSCPAKYGHKFNGPGYGLFN